MAPKTFYDILGVSKEAGLSEIKSAYKSLALKCHPDKNGNTAESTTAFQQLNEAHEILSDHKKRRGYNEQLTEQESQSSTYEASTARNEDGSRHWAEEAMADIEKEKARKSYEGGREPQWLTDARLRYREMLRLHTTMLELITKILALEDQDEISQDREDEAMRGVETQDGICNEASEESVREKFKGESDRRKQQLQYLHVSLRVQEMEHHGLFWERDKRKRQRSRDEQDRVFHVEMEEFRDARRDKFEA